ncbi:CNNM domain-containing protein [Mariniblastus sp.]|nr:CNNM domain-containing protein [Mariniblastus sp.]
MILIVALVLLVVGVFLSASFSGSETGFYRASRVRLVMAALDGDRISGYLLKLINQPSLFVATMLIGNNVANYMTSLAIVLLTHQFTNSQMAEMLAPVLLAPGLFIYGELLPKNLFYHAPNYMLRLASPLVLLFTVLVFPISIVLWGLNRVLEKIVGASPQRVRSEMARTDLVEAIDEGTEAGILHPTQRELSQNFFVVASKPVKEVCTPLARVTAIKVDTPRQKALKLARSKKLPDIPVFEKTKNNLIGHIRTVELVLDAKRKITAKKVEPLMKIPADEVFGEAIMQMQASRQTLALVVGPDSKPIGLLSIDQLTDPLLKGRLGSLKR